MAQNYECTLKQGDTGPPVRAHILNDNDRTEPDLTDAVVTFKLLQIDAETGELIELFDNSAVVESPVATSGTIRYDWGTGDTTGISGRFMSLFKIVFEDGTIEHYPDPGYIWVTIELSGAT